MKPLSKIYEELGIAFEFPIRIKDAKGNETYYEDCFGSWEKSEYDDNGNETYCENNSGFWWKREYDANGKETYYEHSHEYWEKREYDSNGFETYYESSLGTKRGTPKSAKTCEGKVVEVDGVKYELKAL